MRRPPIALVACLGLCTVSMAGCGGSGSAPAGMGDAGSGGASGGGTGGATSNLDGAASACPPRDPSKPDTCNDMPNSATMITGTVETGTAPLPMGGAVLDGRYHATALQLYGASAGDTGSRRTTITITNSGTQIFWVVEAAANGATSMGRLNTTAAFSGTSLNTTLTCTSGAVNLPATLGYTATRDTLALQLTSGTTTTVTTYTRMGCLP